MEENSKLPINRVFWSLIIVSFVSLLVGISPDNTSKYKNALNELEELQLLPRSASTTYRYVAPDVDKELGVEWNQLISEILNETDKKFISPNVLPSIELFWVDEGPLGLPTNIGDIFQRFQKNIGYSVRVPVVDQFKRGLSDILDGAPKEFTFVSDIDVACNWANQRCNISVVLNDDLSESKRHHEEIKIDAVLVKLENSSFWAKVRSQNPYFEGTNIKLHHINRILYEVYDLDTSQAIKYINNKLSSSQNDVEVLGANIKGNSVVSVLPLVIISIMMFLLVIIKEIGSKSVEEKYLETPLFYTTPYGVISKWIMFVLLPVSSGGLIVVRFFDPNVVASWLGVGIMIFAIFVAWLITREIHKLTKKT